MTSHLISIKTTRPNKDSETSLHKVTCSCGHYVGESDSRVAASQRGQAHTLTPECQKCHHRNEHNASSNGIGCSYTTEPQGEVQWHSLCMCGGDYAPGSSVNIATDVYQVGQAKADILVLDQPSLDEYRKLLEAEWLKCEWCGHKEHGQWTCGKELTVEERAASVYKHPPYYCECGKMTY